MYTKLYKHIQHEISEFLAIILLIFKLNKCVGIFFFLLEVTKIIRKIKHPFDKGMKARAGIEK